MEPMPSRDVNVTMTVEMWNAVCGRLKASEDLEGPLVVDGYGLIGIIDEAVEEGY
jgi:hypothetical protein